MGGQAEDRPPNFGRRDGSTVVLRKQHVLVQLAGKAGKSPDLPTLVLGSPKPWTPVRTKLMMVIGRASSACPETSCL
jgi:hypothetical protein